MPDAIAPTPPATGPPARLSHLPALLFFIVLVAAVNLPLVMRLNTHVVGRSFDDTFEVLWQLSALKSAIFQTHTNPFYSPHVFYPQGWYLASGAQPTWYLLLLSPLTAVAGPVVALNVTLLATFVIGGLGAYRLAARLTGRRAAGLLAGCVYIAAPMLTLRLGGHVHVLIAAMFLPYAADAMHRLMTRPAHAARATALAGLLLAASILGHWYFLFIATLPIGGLALATPSSLPWRTRLSRLLAAGAIALIVVAPFALLTWQARHAMLPSGGSYSLHDTAYQGFSLDYLLSPNPFHPLWGARAAALFPVGGEWDVASVGYAALALAALGLLASPRRQSRPFLVMGLISLVLGLGPALRWRGQPLVLNLPPWLSRPLAALAPELSPVAGPVAVLLPALLLYRWLPLYSSLRVHARFHVPLMLAVAVLAGLGATWLLGRGRGGQLLLLLLGSVVVLEGLIVPFRDFTPVAVNHRAVDAWLAAQPADTALIEYPRPWLDVQAMYSQSRHGRFVVNGYMSFQPAFLAAVDAQLGEWPNADALPVLREWGVDYVIVSGLPDVAVFRDAVWPAILAVEGLCLVQSFPDAFSLADVRQTHVFAVQAAGAECPAAVSP